MKTNQSKWQKVRFGSARGEMTAGLVIDTDKCREWTVADFSRLFPYSEAGKMRVFYSSPVFTSFEEAFAFQFPN